MSETLSTLSFAQRAKLIKNTAILNEDTCGSIAALQAEVLRLRSLLQNSKSSASMASELTEDTNSTEDGFISSFRRQADRAEQRASLLENEITEQKEVIHTLKRKLDEAVMARKFKERRIEYFQKKNDGTLFNILLTRTENTVIA
jgi:septal ring factor EnvC (AmiA/AmiB activator)